MPEHARSVLKAALLTQPSKQCNSWVAAASAAQLWPPLQPEHATDDTVTGGSNAEVSDHVHVAVAE